MIRWCAWCQQFIGEGPPFDLYSVTHGICPSCVESGRAKQPITPNVTTISRFYELVREAGTRGDLRAAANLIDRGEALGLKSEDILIGLVQPALYEIGDRWEGGGLTIAEEQRFTAVATSIVDLAISRHPGYRRLRQSPQPDIVLSNVEGNTHVLGVRIAEFSLVVRGVSCYAVQHPLPARELVELARAVDAPFLGLSVSMPSQLPAVERVLTEMTKIGYRPRVILGGFAFRGRSWQPDLDVLVCTDMDDAAAIISGSGLPGQPGIRRTNEPSAGTGSE